MVTTSRRSQVIWTALLVAVALCLVGLVVYVERPANSSHTRTIDHYGLTTLKQMGVDDQVLRRDGADSSTLKGVRFAFPPEARQGPRDWYILKLHYEMRIARDSGVGRIYLYAGTNGRSAAMIVFDVRKRKGGSIQVERSDIGIITGNERTSIDRFASRGQFENYLQIAGVRGGTSELSFKYLEFGKARIDYWKIYNDSGIERTRHGPSSISLIPEMHDRHIRVGDQFSIGYRVENDGGLAIPAGGTVLLRVDPARSLLVKGSRSRVIGTIRGGEAVSGAFRIRAMSAGSIPAELEVSSQTGESSTAKFRDRKSVV